MTHFITSLCVNFGYSQNLLKFNLEKLKNIAGIQVLKILKNGKCVWDLEIGTLLYLSGKSIVAATLGFKQLNKQEIAKLYGNPTLFHGLKEGVSRQLENKKGAYWVLNKQKVEEICL